MSSEVLISSNNVLSKAENEKKFRRILGTSNTVIYEIEFAIAYLRGPLNKFPDFFRMGTFIDSTRMKL